MVADRMRCTAVLVCLAVCWRALPAQERIELPAPPAVTQAPLQEFSFASDGPTGPGWTRPDEIARTYFHEQLPALFRRTIALSGDVPAGGKLSWIFTGPHAGFTVELTSDSVRLTQRYYDSSGLYSGKGNYPEKIVADDVHQFAGHARTLTIVVDAHLAVPGSAQRSSDSASGMCIRCDAASTHVFWTADRAPRCLRKPARSAGERRFDCGEPEQDVSDNDRLRGQSEHSLRTRS